MTTNQRIRRLLDQAREQAKTNNGGPSLRGVRSICFEIIREIDEDAERRADEIWEKDRYS